MGVLNVTPDSFSDGGSYLEPGAAVRHGLELAAQGADILDIGGESTRPGAEPVSESEELRRVIPVIRQLRRESPILLSIDTTKAAVADAALAEGADIINDITALRKEPQMAEVAVRHRAGVVLMHMQGTPRTMQQAPDYTDVTAEVAEFLRQRLAWAVRSGMAVESIALDPGIGFGKKPAHNLALMRHLATFAEMGRPTLIGVSRKSFLGWLSGADRLDDRLWAGVALTSFGREHGTRIFRVHDPRPHCDALRMTEAILHPASNTRLAGTVDHA